jgi:hypothetical protein
MLHETPGGMQMGWGSAIWVALALDLGRRVGGTLELSRTQVGCEVARLKKLCPASRFCLHVQWLGS